MRFMMLMYPKGYENAKPGTLPDHKAMEVMGKYNEQLGQAGVLLALEGLHPPSMDGARITFKDGKSKVTGGPFHSGEVARRGARMGVAHPWLGPRNGRSAPGVFDATDFDAETRQKFEKQFAEDEYTLGHK